MSDLNYNYSNKMKKVPQYNKNLYIDNYSKQLEGGLKIKMNNLELHKANYDNNFLNKNKNNYKKEVFRQDRKEETGFFTNFINVLFGIDAKENAEKHGFNSKESKDSTDHSLNKNDSSFSTEERNSNYTSFQHNTNEKVLFIPCLNCGNTISLDDIEKHSEICINVKKDVLLSDQQNCSLKGIDHKLKKMYESVKLIKENTESKAILAEKSQQRTSTQNKQNSYSDVVKDMPIIISLLQYLTDMLKISEGSDETLLKMKKVLQNLETLILTFKGNISTMILLDRSKLLCWKKYSLIREGVGSCANIKINKNENFYPFKKSNSQPITHGSQDLSDLTILQKQISERRKKAEELQIEKDMWKRKANSFMKTQVSQREHSEKSRFSNINYENKENISPLQTLESNANGDDHFDYFDPSKERITLQSIDDIHSDLEVMSRKSCLTDLTNLTSCSEYESDLRPSLFQVCNKDQNTSSQVNKMNYREFVKTFLKVKFQANLDKNTKLISEKAMWNDIVKQNIQPEKWTEYICDVFNNPQNYNHYLLNKKATKFGSR
jgi:hypothetical protein